MSDTKVLLTYSIAGFPRLFARSRVTGERDMVGFTIVAPDQGDVYCDEFSISIPLGTDTSGLTDHPQEIEQSQSVRGDDGDEPEGWVPGAPYIDEDGGVARYSWVPESGTAVRLTGSAEVFLQLSNIKANSNAKEVTLVVCENSGTSKPRLDRKSIQADLRPILTSPATSIRLGGSL